MATRDAFDYPPSSQAGFQHLPSGASTPVAHDLGSPSTQRTFSVPGTPTAPLDSPSIHTGTEVVFALPAVDTGYAWIFLTAAFFVELLAFGYTFSIGVFHEFWSSTLFPGEGNAVILTLAATIQSGLMYVSAIVITPFYTRYPEYRQIMQHTGCVLSAGGILASGFASKPWHLVVTSGVFYPIGGSMVYLPAATLVFEWFQKKRGLANGIMYSGAGLGGATFPLIMQALLTRFSYKAACISLALGYGLLANIAVHYVKPRVPVTRRTAYLDNMPEMRRTKISWTFLKTSAFWAFGGAIVMSSMGSFLPSIYLPEFAVDIGLSKGTGTILLVVMNLSSVFGLLVQGYLSDRWPIKLVLFLSCLGSSITCFFLFGFANTPPVLATFAVFWGFFGLGFSSLWTRLIMVVSKNDPLSPPVIFGIFFMLRGICSVVSGPVSSVLLQGAALPDARFGYGVKDYGGLILFIGAVNAVGAIVGICYKES